MVKDVKVTSRFLQKLMLGGIFKAGVHLKAVFTPLKIGSTEISRSRFKQYKNRMLITQINVLECFVNFWVIFRYIWEEIVFLKREVKLTEIRNIEDLAKS